MGPVILAAVILAVLLGIGYWVQNGNPLSSIIGKTPAAKKTPSGTAPAAASQPADAKAPAAATPAPAKSAPPADSKPVQPADPNKAILDARSHLDRSGGAAKTMTVTLYYADGLKEQALQPVEVLVPQSVSLVQAVAEQLVVPVQNVQLFTAIPAGTKVQSVDLNTQTGVATVDLSPEVAQARGISGFETIRAAFVYSLTEVRGVNAVLVKANGHTFSVDGLDWSQPATREAIAKRNLFKVEPPIKFQPKT